MSAVAKRFAEIDDVRFRVAVNEGDASESDRHMFTDYNEAVAALELFAERLPELVAAARDPFAAGAAERLEKITDAFHPFTEGCDGALLSVLWDAARALIKERKRCGSHAQDHEDGVA